MTYITSILLGKRRIAAIVLAMVLLATMSMAVPALNGDGGKLLAQTTDALDRYLDRSPGERSETDLLKGKERKGTSLADRLFGRRANSGGDPEQRALGKIFDTPPETSVRELGQTPGPIDLTAPPASDLLPLGVIDGTPVGGGIGSAPGFPGGIGAFLPPGTSTTPGGPTAPGDPTTPGGDTPVAAVPEPETWALMLIGFGFCGALLRRRREHSTKRTPSIA